MASAMLLSFALVALVTGAEPQAAFDNVPFQVQLQDRLFKPDLMPADQRRLAKEGALWPIQFQGGLDIRQRGGWMPEILPQHQRILDELSRFVHVEVYASTPVG